MIMDSRIAAELLYESEATLRMVDTALDELRVGDDDDDLRIHPTRMQTLSVDTDGGEEFEVPPDFCVRAYWQVQEVADCVREGRELLRALKPQVELSADRYGRLDRVLSLIDRLDSSEGSATRGDSALLAQLRTEVMGVLEREESAEGAAKHISLAMSYLAEAEGRLTKLGHVFDLHD